MTRHPHFIDNRPAEPRAGRWLEVIDPADGRAFAAIARGDALDIDDAVRAARHAYEGPARDGSPDGPWGRTPAAERGRILARLANIVLREAEKLAAIESRDTGKPISQARADARALARYFEFYGGAADKLTGQSLPYLPGYQVVTMREPHGVTGHIVPWNYPMQIFGRSVGAALAAGNACVVKPAEDACLSLLALAPLAAEAGLPPGALNIVCGLGAEAGEALAAHPDVDHLSFTGSGPTGERVTRAAAARHCPVTLELGGKSAQLVFADADLDAAAPVLVNAAIQNAGQTCSAGSRVLVQREVHAALTDRLAAAFERLVSGPGSADHDLGPLINARQLQRVRGFIEQARADGLRQVASGRVAADASAEGYFHAAALFDQVPAEHALAQQEVFGPVLTITPFESDDDALRIANGTPYGLVAGIWTREGARQMRLARRLRAGQVFVNNYGAGGGVELPFGGVKRSGHGREKGFEALYGFTVLKTVATRWD